jgi:CheY-like chemotaxis protein
MERPLKILVIDDSRFQRSQLVRMLTELGHDVVQGTNGEEGFQKILEEKPDLVFSDLLMPVLDGQGLLMKARDHGLETPIVICSADVQSSTREACRQMGARAFVTKPCGQADLAGAIETVLASRNFS